MDNQLKLLIALCEEERIRLQKLIDGCIAETEYLMAHYHSEALHQLNGRLHTLNNLDDKLYDEKDSIKSRIEVLQQLMGFKSSENSREYWGKRLEKEKEKLERLNQVPKQATPTENETFFDETIKKLLDKDIKNLKLILKKNDNLLLIFSYSKKVLKVTLPYVKQHTKKWILYEDKINSFKNLGFDLIENETKLTLMLMGEKEDILERLKIILAKIVFEIFYFKEFENESYIQFTNKANR